jgi:hypothetical protein
LEYNINVDLGEIGYEFVNWVYSVQDRIHKRSEVDMVVNLGVALNKVTS